MHGEIMYVEFALTNVDETINFYTTLFNWKFTESFLTKHRYFMFETPGKAIYGGFDALIKPTSDGPIVYLLVDDIEVMVSLINEKFENVRILKPKTFISKAFGSFALIIDPSGNKIGLHENPKI